VKAPIRSQDCNAQLQAQPGFERLVIATSASFAKRTLTKGGEYDFQTFGYNQLLSGGTVTTSLCTCVWFLWRTTLLHCQNFEHQKQYDSTAIIAEDNQGNASAQSQLVNAFISVCGNNVTHVQIPLDSSEDLLFVQVCLAIYYSMLERSLLLAFLRPTRHQVVSTIYGAPIIYSWKQAGDTAI
jgi:hypothetical protein